MVRVPLSIMLQPNQMAIYRYERILCCTHVHLIRAVFIHIARIYPKPSALMATLTKMLWLEMKQCTIFCHAMPIVVQANRIQQIFSITMN